MAMLLGNRGLLERAEIVATDLSERVLERARRGQFNGRSLRALPHPEMGRYLDMQGRLDPALIEAVRWSRLNLLEGEAIRALGAFDAILCRNVLIYFGDRVSQQVVLQLFSSLAPQGVLLVGLSESLLRMGSLVRCEEHGGFFLYRPGSA